MLVPYPIHHSSRLFMPPYILLMSSDLIGRQFNIWSGDKPWQRNFGSFSRLVLRILFLVRWAFNLWLVNRSSRSNINLMVTLSGRMLALLPENLLRSMRLTMMDFCTCCSDHHSSYFTDNSCSSTLAIISDGYEEWLSSRLIDWEYMYAPTSPGHVCHLHRAIYGLKQNPLAWFEYFRRALTLFGFQQSTLADFQDSLHDHHIMVSRRVSRITLCLCGPHRRDVFFYCCTLMIW